MRLTKECAMELCKSFAAAAVLGGHVANLAVTPGTGELLVAGAGLIASLGHERAQEIENIVTRMANRVVHESETWIRARRPGAAVKREAALPAVMAALPMIAPSPKELVGLGLDRKRIVALYLDRAASGEKTKKIFSSEAGNEVARELLGDIVGYAFDEIRKSPEITSHALEKLLAVGEAHSAALARTEDTVARTENRIAELPQNILAHLIPELEKQGFIRKAEQEGLERQTILALARRLKPEEALNIEQAITELEKAVAVALDLRAQGKHVGNLGEFVDSVFARVEKLNNLGALDKGADEFDAGIAEIDKHEMEQRAQNLRARVALYEGSIKQEILRRDASAVAKRIEALVALETEDGPAAWSPAFRARFDRFDEEGTNGGINLSLEVAIVLARLMARDASDSDERGVAGNLLGNALRSLGERESGTARLEEAVTAYRAALMERTRERVPLDWAMTQNNLGTALSSLGERESGTARLEEAVTAYRAALMEFEETGASYYADVTRPNLARAEALLTERQKSGR